MATGPDKYAGEHCKKVGLSIEQFYSASTRVRMTKISNIKKGLIYELSLMRKSQGMPWKDFYELEQCVMTLSRSDSIPSKLWWEDWRNGGICYYEINKKVK